MKLLALSVALLALAPAKKNNTAPPDPDAALAKAYGGRVWADDQAPPGTADLPAWLAAHRARAEVDRKEKDGSWNLSYVSVFKRPAAKGPMTVELFDKTDPVHIVDQCSSDNPSSSVVYRGSCELDPDHGFNKGHTYLVKVGQIIKGKFQPYATGEVTLK